MPTLSLCMIVKEYTLEFAEAIESLYKYVDEFVIATQDKKWVERVKNEGPKNNLLKAYYYEWTDDFAAARNDTFSKATGDYIFWIDADDTVIHAENLPKIVEKMAQEQIDWVHLEYLYEKDEQGRVRMRQWKPRITRKGTGVWKKPVHEVFEPTQEVSQIMLSDVVIDHQHKGMLHTKESGERNLRILMKEFDQDKEKTEPRTLYYLGNTLMGLDRYQEAIPFYLAHIKQCGWPEEKYFSMHYLSHCMKWEGRVDEAINLGLEMTKFFPQWNLAYFDLAEYYSFKQDYKRVIEWTLVGLTKERPDSKAYFTSDTDYTVNPMSRLAHAYILDMDYDKALQIAQRLVQENPTDPGCQELLEIANEAWKAETFVESFITVAGKIADTDRIKAVKLFEALPVGLDEDARIQASRFQLVPPKNWPSNSLVIYCGKGNGAEWAQPSIYQGIGGSEEAVINMGEQLTKLGYEVTVYNHCGDYRGTYAGVHYEPYYHFNAKDNFATLIAWRTPGLFNFDLKAKKKIVWLHDIAYPQQFSPKCLDQVDTFIFLSQWHRNNMPTIPDTKIFISNNGINPKDFEHLPLKEPNTLFWGSSYDRGLLPFIQNILPLIQKEVPDVKLHVAYGWNNIDREINAQPGIFPDLEALKATLAPLLETNPAIIHHNRLSHKALAQLMGQCLVYPYASEFGETCNITSQKCQAAGVYVVTTSQAGGTPERLEYGGLIKGDGIYTNKELQREFADTVIDFLKNPNKYDAPGTLSNMHVIEKFSWATTAQTLKEGLL